jgi:hypothetical protein
VADPAEKIDLSDDEAFRTAIKAKLKDAIDYVDDTLAPDREEATSYYRGDPLGNEELGRSEVVMSEVRDVVQAMLPSLLRIFTGAQNAVEFMPRSEQKVPMAEQATDYVNHVFYNENRGFNVLYNGFKDALIRKTGILTWYTEETKSFEDLEYEALDDQELKILAGDDDVEIEEIEELPDGAKKVKIRKYTSGTKLKVEAVPPEEFFIARDARCEDTASIIGRRRDLYVHDLVAMGYDEEEVREHMGSGDAMELNTEAETRNPAIRNDKDDSSDKEVSYFEAYLHIDRDGDGVAELIRVCGINIDSPYILHEEVWADGVPFGILCPDPEPHMAVGYSIADQVKDLQVIKTNVVRNTLDSLANSIHPRTVVVEDMVNIDDAMNTEVGAIIRTRQPGMVQSLETPFVGQYSLPIIEYLDRVGAKRTGITEASQGLDADVLQSTTKAAVTATVSAAQERIEMIARIFAETGLRRMFRGLLKLATRYIDKEAVIRIRNTWVPMDPRVWDADMDVHVNIGLGRGTDADKLALYNQVLQWQMMAVQMAGPTNPLAGIPQIRNTVVRMMEIGGERDVSRFFKPVTDEMLQQMQAQQPPPPPAPEMIIAQAEAQKAQADIQAKQATVQVKQQEVQLKAQTDAQAHEREIAKLKMENDLKRDQMAMEFELKRAEIEAKYAAQVQIEQMKAEMERERQDYERAMNMQIKSEDREFQREQADTDRAMQFEQSERDREHQGEQKDKERMIGAVSQTFDREHQGKQADEDRKLKAKQFDAAAKAKAATAKKGPAK